MQQIAVEHVIIIDELHGPEETSSGIRISPEIRTVSTPQACIHTFDRLYLCRTVLNVSHLRDGKTVLLVLLNQAARPLVGVHDHKATSREQKRR